jgi:hypothetical protein
MNRNTYKHIFALGIVLLVSVAILAAPSQALRVEGARISLDVEAGKTYTSPIGISISANESEVTLAIDVMGFGQMPDNGTYTGLNASADTSPYSARPFITVDQPTVHLMPGERANVTATIAVPAGTKDGGRYAIILIHPAASTSGAPASFATAVAIPVFLTVKEGTLTEVGEISSLGPGTVETGEAFHVVTAFKNTGNYHYYGAQVNVTIADASGKVVANVGSEPFERAIVPGQSVNFTSAIDAGLPAGTYNLTSHVGQQDGKVFAEKSTTLQVENSNAGLPCSSAPMALLGIVFVLLGACVYVKRSRR